MGLFDFFCDKCKNTFEVVIKSDQNEIECPKCTTEAEKVLAKKIASWDRMSFKCSGTGFHNTDYSKYKRVRD